MSAQPFGSEVVLADGPYRNSRFRIDRLEDMLLIADEPLTDDTAIVDPADPPVPVAVYELVTEFIGGDGDREGTYRYAGHRYPVSPQPGPGPGPPGR